MWDAMQDSQARHRSPEPQTPLRLCDCRPVRSELMNFGDFEKNIECKLHKRQFRNLPEDTTMPLDRVFVTSVEMDN